MDGTTGALRLYSEQGTTDYNAGFTASGAMTENTFYTLPNNGGTSNQVLTTTGGANPTLSWQSATSLANGWSLSGNSGTTAGTNFIGTTDAVDLSFKTNNTEKLRVTSAGNVGIGTTSPDSRLVIVSDESNNAQGLKLQRQFNFVGGAVPLSFSLLNSTSSQFRFATISGGISVNTSGSEKGFLSFQIADGSGSWGMNYEQEKMRLNNSGLGIGTLPTQKLDVKDGNILLSNSATAGELRFQEANANGTNYTAFKAPTTLGSDITYTLPSTSGNANEFLSTDGAGVLSWKSASATAWSLSGNSGTNASTNFIGTTDVADLVFRTSNSERVRISSTGNVSIGSSSSAGAKFRVTGNDVFYDNNSSGIYLSSGTTIGEGYANWSYDLGGGATGNPYVRLSLNPRNNNNLGTGLRAFMQIQKLSGNDKSEIFFATSDAAGTLGERMRINGDGKVGIGTSNPLDILDVRGSNAKATTSATEDLFQVASSDAASPLNLTFGIKTDATANNRYTYIKSDDAGTARSLILQPAGGRVGIGTTNPTTALHVNGDINFTNAILLNGNYGTAGYVLASTGVGPSQWLNPSTFLPSGANAWTKSGTNIYNTTLTDNVGIGTSAPAQKLDVNGNIQIPAANDYLYATPKTKYVRVPITAFNHKKTVSTSTELIFDTYVTSGYDGESSYCYFVGGTTGNVAIATAPVYLPDGAIVTSLEAAWFDQNVTYNATLSLERMAGSSINNETMASISTSGSATIPSGMVTTTQTTITSATISNQNYSYYLKLKTIENANNLAFVRVRITYTISSAEW
jgi:hypothetical protein